MTRAPTRARVVPLLVVGALVAAVVVGLMLVRPGAPSTDPPTTAERRAAALSDALGRPAGAAAVDVGAGRDQRGHAYVATVVTLDSRTTGDEVAAVVAAMPAATRRAGLGSTYSSRQLAFVTDSGARLTVAWEPEIDTAAVGRAAAGWLAVAAGRPAGSDVAAIVLTGGAISYRLALGRVEADRDLLDGYDRAAAAVAREPSQLQDRVQWQVTATSAGTSLELSSYGPLESAEEHTWTALLADARRVRAPVAPSRLEATFRDRLEVHLTVLAPDSVGGADFTPASYGGEVRPAARPQLRAVRALTTHWSYFLAWAHRSTPDSEQLIALLYGDQGSVRDATGKDRSPDASAGWAQQLLGDRRRGR